MRPYRLGRAALAGGLALLVLATAAAAFFLSGGSTFADSAFGGAPGGSSSLVETAGRLGVPVRTIESEPYLIEDLPHDAPTAVLVTRIDRPLTTGEVDALVAFVHRGGHLVVATTDAGANALARRFGVTLDGHAILSRAGDGLVLTAADGTTVPTTPATALVADPSLPPGSVSVTLEAGASTFLDMNGDGRVDSYDRSGPFVVGLRVADASGGGAIDIIGSRAFLTNAGYDAAASEALLRATVPEGGSLVVFEGARAHPAQPVFTAASLLESGTRQAWLRPTLILLALAGAGLVAWAHRGPASLAHVYAGDRETHRSIERDHLVEGLRALVLERARERAGLTPQDFDALGRDDRRAWIESTLDASSDRPADRELLSHLRLE